MNWISTLPQDYEPLGAPGSLKPTVKQCPTFATKSTNEIMNTLYAPVMWVVEGYLPEGFSVLAGRQKLGKTWLAIDWAIAVATGGCAMGEITCERGDVLYIDMENGDRRIQRRVETIFPNSANRPDLSRLQWAGDVIALGKGFIGAIEKWRLSAAKYVHLDRSDLLTQAPPTKNDKKIRKPQSPDTNTLETFDESIDGQSNPPGPPIRNVRSPIRTEPDERESELPELPEFLRRTQQ